MYTSSDMFDAFRKIQPQLEEIGLPLNSPNETYHIEYADGFTLTVSYNGNLTISLSKIVFGTLFTTQFAFSEFVTLNKELCKEYIWSTINKIYAQIGQEIENKRKYLYNKGELT